MNLNADTFAAVLARRRRSHVGELDRLRQHRAHWLEKLARLERQTAHNIAIAADESAPLVHRQRAADAIERDAPGLEQMRHELARVDCELDAELARFHAGHHPSDPRPLEAALRAALAGRAPAPAVGVTVARRTSTRRRRPRARRTRSPARAGAGDPDLPPPPPAPLDDRAPA